MADQLREIRVFAVFICPHHLCHFQTGYIFDQQHFQLSVGGIRVGNGTETAAVEAAVAGSDEGLPTVDAFAIHFDHIVLVNTLDHIDQSRYRIGTETAE